MAEYIRKDSAVLLLRANADMEVCDHAKDCFERAVKMIELLPTIPHGKWKDGDPYCPVCGRDKFKGLDADVFADWKPDYCPNCGTRMD